jgi:hypothetical protein
MSEYDKNCLRRIANFTTVKNQFKFDNKSFEDNKELLKKSLPTYSPKLVKLIEVIKDLDDADAKKGKLFKHFIFSDVPFQGAGAKVTASVLEAYGYKLVYDKKHNMLEKAELLRTRGRNFALLCQTPVFGKPLPISKQNKGKLAIINMFNERPDNIHGDVCRFIILDRGFKEGIDLFDVKYVHVLEPQTSHADLRQAIGRATRHCGQEGLAFDDKKGWELKVYVYDAELPEKLRGETGSKTLFELYQKAADIDMRQLVFAAELEKTCIQGSVDFVFNKPIHTFNQDASGANKSRRQQMGGYITSKALKWKPSLMPIAQDNKSPTKGIAIGPRKWKPSLPSIAQNASQGTAEPRNHKWKPSLSPIAQNASQDEIDTNKPSLIAKRPKWKPSLSPIAQSLSEGNSPIAETVINEAIPVRDDVQSNDFHEKMIPALKGKPTFVSVRDYVSKHMSQFAWPPLKLQNECKQHGGDSLSQFLPSQNFVRHFFTPAQPMKGMLFWHSVGTGKTCAAIATASTTFAQEGYKILWVTRRTLRGDLWKDMFLNVCDA